VVSDPSGDIAAELAQRRIMNERGVPFSAASIMSASGLRRDNSAVIVVTDFAISSPPPRPGRR
jgi:hypothetical protein